MAAIRKPLTIVPYSSAIVFAVDCTSHDFCLGMLVARWKTCSIDIKSSSKSPRDVHAGVVPDECLFEVGRAPKARVTL